MTESAKLSSEEFQRLQSSLLELRSSNYQLAEQITKKDRENAALEQKIRKLEEEIQRSTKGRRGKTGDILDVSESEALRHKLATQEEEFRLQQATLIEELQRVIAQQEELEKQVRDLKDGKGSENVESERGGSSKQHVEEVRGDYEGQLAELRKALEDERQAKQLDINRQIEKIQQLETELATVRKTGATLEQENKNLMERLGAEMECQTKYGGAQKEIAELKDQLLRKQASYVSLSEEKERQLTEFKKSLDGVVQKKDAEITAVVDELNACKKQIQMVKDNERVSMAEKASLDTALKASETEMQKIREQNESYQIQLQETLSANDCLSSQLQETRGEVERMQGQLEEAKQLANKRKALLDEMNSHLEEVKEEYRKKEEELTQNQERQVADLKEQLEQMQKRTEEMGPLEQKVLLLESLLQTSEDRSQALEKRADELTSNFQSCETKQEEMLQAQRVELNQQMEMIQKEADSVRLEYESRVESLTAERDELAGLVQQLKQEVKDKEDAIKAVERKYLSLIKDLKRQLQGEKKRYDRLQEKIQESSAVVAETGRNRSPGNTSFEEIRPMELSENRPRTVGDAASVSSWTVVSGNAQKESDRHSTHTGDRDSESSITMLESDNHELITRVTELQKKNFELQERVILLEESNFAMAEDLINKASVIEQFLKEKPAIHMGVPPSPEKLPPSLKKVIDLMKIDQSAAEIRDMNKRLQRMLEETLTKNMHLQKDLEVMSREVARLTSA